MSSTVIQRHRWVREEYERMVAAGVFHPEARLELIDGEVVNMTPQGSQHATAVQLAEDALRKVFSTGYITRVQMPLALEEDSEPEPDMAVVPGSPRDYRDAHPESALLVVEVADATLAFDRDQKKRLYARTGVPEYWIVDLIDRHLEIYRNPRGEEYRFHSIARPGESVSSPIAAEEKIPVSELMS